MSRAQSGFASFRTHFYFTGWCKAILDNCGFGLGMGARQEMRHFSFVNAIPTKAPPFQNKQRRTGHPEGQNRRRDWIRTKAPFADPVFFGWRTKNLGKEGAFDAGYWM